MFIYLSRENRPKFLLSIVSIPEYLESGVNIPKNLESGVNIPVLYRIWSKYIEEYLR